MQDKHIDEIIEDALWQSNVVYGASKDKLVNLLETGIQAYLTTEQLAIWNKALELLDEDEPLQTQSDYDKKNFGHPKNDALPALPYVRQAARNHFRAELRSAIQAEKAKLQEEELR